MLLYIYFDWSPWTKKKEDERGSLCLLVTKILVIYLSSLASWYALTLPKVLSTSSSALKKMISFSDHLLLEPCRTECRLRPGAETQPAADADCGFALRQCNNRTLCCAGVCIYTAKLPLSYSFKSIWRLGRLCRSAEQTTMLAGGAAQGDLWPLWHRWRRHYRPPRGICTCHEHILCDIQLKILLTCSDCRTTLWFLRRLLWIIQTAVNRQQTHCSHELWALTCSSGHLDKYYILCTQFQPKQHYCKERSTCACHETWCGNNYTKNMQLDFALVALGFQKENTAAKGLEGSPSNLKDRPASGQSMLETIMGDGTVNAVVMLISSFWFSHVSSSDIWHACGC